ncbi:hypothetical protein N0V82_007917 [Gnomoniopsis sp. IMI 355080]|nr:hypothetical protein N0V82_007917 [Gnomoniopsis sp. IMI 355080]
MPITNRTSHQPLRRDSWPPTQIPLYQSFEADNNRKMDARHNESLIDDDPINSFLSPTPLLDDGDTDDEMDMDLEMDMAFDAGIVDSSRPIPIIRNISPSKLGGGLRPPPPPRTPTPPHLRFGSHSPPSRNSPEVSTPNTDIGFDDYDDGEDYVRLSPLHPGSLNLAEPAFHLGSTKSSSRSRKAKSAAVAAAKAEEKAEDRVALMMARGSSYNDDDDDEYFSASPSFRVGRPKMALASSRGRSKRPALPHLSARPRSWSGATGYGSGRLSPRAWQEPSPDVWSIQEEDEAEISDMDLDTQAVEQTKTERSKGKRVRFALPVREIP